MWSAVRPAMLSICFCTLGIRRASSAYQLWLSHACVLMHQVVAHVKHVRPALAAYGEPSLPGWLAALHGSDAERLNCRMAIRELSACVCRTGQCARAAVWLPMLWSSSGTK